MTLATQCRRAQKNHESNPDYIRAALTSLKRAMPKQHSPESEKANVEFRVMRATLRLVLPESAKQMLGRLT